MGPFAAVALVSLAVPGLSQPVTAEVLGKPSAAVLRQAAPKLVRKEGRYWTYYVPDARWGASENPNGIDITSPDGTYYLGFGFAPTPGPVTFEQMLELAKQYGSLDAHPLRDLRIGQPSAPVPDGPAKQQHVEYTATRTDTNTPMHGVATIDIFNDPSQGVYAYASWVRTTPAADVAKWDPVLAQMQKLIFYKGRGPTPAPAPGPG